jgi:hypothetical protein
MQVRRGYLAALVSGLNPSDQILRGPTAFPCSQHFFEEDPSGRAVKDQLAQPFDPAKGHPDALEHKPYALSPLQAIRVVTARQFKLVLRDRVLVRARLGQVGQCTAGGWLGVCAGCGCTKLEVCTIPAEGSAVRLWTRVLQSSVIAWHLDLT